MEDFSGRFDWGTLLKEQSRRTIGAVSFRTAAKLFPIIFTHANDPDHLVQRAVLNACRVLLTGIYYSKVSASDALGSGKRAIESLLASRHMLPEDCRLAAESLALAVRSFVSGPQTGIEAINQSVIVMLNAARGEPEANFLINESVIHGQISRDVKGLDRDGADGYDLLQQTPLGSDAVFDSFFSKHWLNLSRLGSEMSPAWTFWHRTFEDLVQGRDFDPDLAARVLNIEEQVWEAGPESISNEIDRLKIELLSEQLPSAERLEFNNETGKFNTTPVEVNRVTFIDAVLDQAYDALQDVLTKSSNGITYGSREAVVLKRTFERYRNNPQRIEMDFTSVQQSLSRQISTQELPASEENIALERSLREGAQAIRASHPAINENRKILNKQALLELDDEDRSKVRQALPVLEEISEGDLLLEWGEDVDYLLEARFRSLNPTTALGPAVRNRALASYDQEVRLFGRAARIMILLRSTPEILKRIEQSSPYKAASIISTIAALVALGISLIA
jgi:hypothetical protein